MTEHTFWTSRRRIAVGALATAAIATTIGLVGCTGDTTKPDPSTSGSAAPTGKNSPTAPALKDRSAEVMAGLQKSSVIATAKAKSDDSNVRGSSLQVHSLVSHEESTVLTFTLTSTEISTRLAPGLWDRYPVLTTPTAAYRPVTWLKEPGSSNPWFAVHNPSMWPKANVASPPQTILYPPLPRDVTTVTVTGTWFEDVTVPVTHRP